MGAAVAEVTFLPTPSARRATSLSGTGCPVSQISTHALREEGDLPPSGGQARRPSISTHALREEGDALGEHAAWQCSNFYPRPPRGGRPGGLLHEDAQSDFYPRPPRGGRRISPHPKKIGSGFLPTPSARRATSRPSCPARLLSISTHALREEGDVMRLTNWTGIPYFYPRPPRGGRHQPETPHRSA